MNRSREERKEKRKKKMGKEMKRFMDEIREFVENNEEQHHMIFPLFFPYSRIMTTNEKIMMDTIFDWSQGYPISIPNGFLSYICRCSEEEVSDSLAKLVRMNYLTKVSDNDGQFQSFAVTPKNLARITRKERCVREGLLMEVRGVKSDTVCLLSALIKPTKRCQDNSDIEQGTICQNKYKYTDGIKKIDSQIP